MPPNSTRRPHLRILSLDGGGAKGFYTLGVLKELEELVGARLGQQFDFIYGTSTGAMVAALLGLGQTVDEIATFYREHVPPLVRERTPWDKTKALAQLVTTAFGTLEFSAFQTHVGIVCTHWDQERPLVFRRPPSGVAAAARSDPSCTIAQAVEASCSAFPFFERLALNTATHGTLELADGSYCANNPVLFALADALAETRRPAAELRLVSVGVGVYPRPAYHGIDGWLRGLKSARLIQKMLNVNTESMEQLRRSLFPDLPALRVNHVFAEPEMAIDLMEADLTKLDSLFQRGRVSFDQHRAAFHALLEPTPV